MPYCKKCGTKPDEDAVFCSNCDTPVTRTGNAQPIMQNPEPDAPVSTDFDRGFRVVRYVNPVK